MDKDCVSLEVAQKLQKAGYKSECRWFYGYPCCKEDSEMDLMDYETENIGESECKAPTATQLAEELPSYIRNEKTEHLGGEVKHYQLSIFKGDYNRKPIAWHVLYMISDDWFWTVEADTLPDALGLMMVYLLENKLI